MQRKLLPEWRLLKPVFPAQAGIHGVEAHGKTMDSRLRGNDELLELGLSKCHSAITRLWVLDLRQTKDIEKTKGTCSPC